MKLAVAMFTISDDMSEYDPINRVVFVFEVDANYSVDRLQRFVNDNRELFGDSARFRRLLGTCRSIKHLLMWSNRKRRPKPMLGWIGPARLTP